MKFGVQCLIGKVHLSVSVKKQTEHLIVCTVVKELRLKMFRQHPGYYKAVFVKKKQTIIVNFYEYTVYIMF